MPDDVPAVKHAMALDATEFVRQRQADELVLRTLSLTEKGKMIQAACRTAAVILRSRIKSGQPAPSPAPWPQSTVDFMRKKAPNGQR